MSSSVIAIFITTLIFSPICYFVDICFSEHHMPFAYWGCIIMLSSSSGILVSETMKVLCKIIKKSNDRSE